MRNWLSRKVAHAGLQGNNLDPIDIIKNLYLTFYWQNKICWCGLQQQISMEWRQAKKYTW